MHNSEYHDQTPYSFHATILLYVNSEGHAQIQRSAASKPRLDRLAIQVLRADDT